MAPKGACGKDKSPESLTKMLKANIIFFFSNIYCVSENKGFFLSHFLSQII